MSENVHAAHADLQPADALERRIADLIRHYLRTRSPAIAQSVVRHIEQLCSHPGFEGDARARCGYLRLRTHWRWLAQHAPAARETARP